MHDASRRRDRGLGASRRRHRPARRRADPLESRPGGRRRVEELADRRRHPDRSRRRAAHPRRAARRDARSRDHRRGGRPRRRRCPAAVDDRPARRHGQLHLRDTALRRQHRRGLSTARRRRSCGRRDPRRGVLRRPRVTVRAATACRSPPRRATTSARHWSPPASRIGPSCAGPRARSSPDCCRWPATSAASARPRCSCVGSASGRVDGYFERDTKIWDYAAAALIAAEAGAAVELPLPGERRPRDRDVSGAVPAAAPTRRLTTSTPARRRAARRPRVPPPGGRRPRCAATSPGWRGRPRRPPWWTRGTPDGAR